MELFVSRRARERFELDSGELTFSKGRLLGDLRAARLVAQRINAGLDLVRYPERGVRAGQINVAGMLGESLRRLLEGYREERNPGALVFALGFLYERFGEDAVDRMLLAFERLYTRVPGGDPKAAGVRGRGNAGQGDAEQGDSGEARDPHEVLEDVLLLWCANQNPALAPFRELFDDHELEETAGYREMMASLRELFEEQPGYGSEERNVLTLLREPASLEPESLGDQLRRAEALRPARESREAGASGRLDRVLTALDVLREEDKPVFVGPAGPPPPPPVLDFADQSGTVQRFTTDQSWMPELVMVSKNTLVWLDQLSRAHGLEISRLDQIPDRELERLRELGFTGLWLIGLWERSAASERIKKACGNPEAAASAYAVDDYHVAASLGGEEALEELKERASAHGLRLACDMVPNHTGIDSLWVREHPERFLSLSRSPFPNYTFTGMDLSPDPEVGLFLEDHYYDRSDAAVVFQRVDRKAKETRYIYHGNDGTSLPWNDTAQLDYSQEAVREAVIEQILEVARRFSVIRFDAAMTLARRHVQRLWFPEPGKGGAIPSRAEHGMSQEDLERLIPEEFWRQVVDRVAEAAPDTLLLAEAFWMMEGYFVRGLGMHRVYNSAFMHMLRDEDNRKFRESLKNTLEFDPEILKRFVNYQTNPDEATAVAQFGRDEKYFGVCTLMVTLPGLPMFGHGQVEGLAEKYGMEYRRGYFDESTDPRLVARHEREIAPLLRRRALFAEAEAFRLFDVIDAAGRVLEDVLAFSNRRGEERVLVLFHNREGWTRGSLWFSAPTRSQTSGELEREDLAKALGMSAGGGAFWIFRDEISGLELLRSGERLLSRGFEIELGPYERRVFLDFRQVGDLDGRYERLFVELGGAGVPSLEAKLREPAVEPVHGPLRRAIGAEPLGRLLEEEPADFTVLLQAVFVDVGEALQEADAEVDAEAEAAGEPESSDGDWRAELPGLVEGAARSLQTLRLLAREEGRADGEDVALSWLRERAELLDQIEASSVKAGGMEPHVGLPSAWYALASWVVLGCLEALTPPPDAASTESEYVVFDEWLLGRLVGEALEGLGFSSKVARQQAAAVRLFVGLRDWARDLGPDGVAGLLGRWLEDEAVQSFLGVNRFDEVVWFNRDAYRVFVWWLAAVMAIDEEGKIGDVAWVEGRKVIELLDAAEAASGYRLTKLLETVALDLSHEAGAWPDLG